ncbi:hypothetical protein V5N11_002006 [Cardamine amara subsp. amara]|uniref:Endonuclease/exonuclease/phosphatase domain-containing protein n=1 Tax=Cardamine amara subsp. amara TaxID=228776 RepID=A0ABD0ZRC8_CARAN
MFLIETKQKLEYVTSLQKSLGYDKIFTVEPLGLSGGLAVFWKQSYNVEVLYADNRIIDVKVMLGSRVFVISFVYGDTVRALRNQVWERLADIGIARNDAWFLVGDFNELLNKTEKREDRNGMNQPSGISEIW